MSEQVQAIGSATRIFTANESVWGEFDDTTTKRHLRLVGGETMDSGTQTVQSEELRADRIQQQFRNVAQDPGGSIPFELSGQGWYPWIYHLLFGDPVASTTGSLVEHVIKGAVTPPVGFTLEKGYSFSDASNLYLPFYGCRVDGMRLELAVNQIVKGTFDVVAREAGELTATSLNTGADPAIPTADPFVSTDLTVMEGDTLAEIATITQATINIRNQYYRDRSYVLGSNLRANLIPGIRITDGSITAKFASAAMFNKALNETMSALQFAMTDGDGNAVTFLLPSIKFKPTGGTPKIADDGPVDVTLEFQAGYDSTYQTDVVATLVGPDEDLTA